MTHTGRKSDSNPLESKADRRRIVVLGAGQAGLAAAYCAARRGIPVTVLEGRETVGGVGGSFEIDGINVDYGSHRFNPACDTSVLHDMQDLLRDDLLRRPKNSRLRLGNAWVRLPVRLADFIRVPKRLVGGIGIDLAGAAIQGLRRSADREMTFQTLLVNDLGRTLCRSFYFPYVQKVWGVPPDQLPVPPLQQNGRNRNLFSTFVRNGFSAVVGKKTSTHDFFIYPRQGYGQIAECYYKAAKQAGAEFRFGSRVTGIDRQENQVTAVRYMTDDGEQTIPTSCVWSTLPITLLARGMTPAPPENILNAASNLSFRGMILIYLVLEQERFTEFDTHFIPDEDIPITRVSEPKNYTDLNEPQEHTILCLEMPCNRDSNQWDLSDERLGQLACQWLEAAGLPIRSPVRKVVTRRLPIAYPVYREDTFENLQLIHRWLSQFSGLLTFGLQGLFAHDDSHHVLYMAYCAVDSLDEDGEFDWQRWQSFREVFERNVATFLRSMNAISL